MLTRNLSFKPWQTKNKKFDFGLLGCNTMWTCRQIPTAFWNEISGSYSSKHENDTLLGFSAVLSRWSRPTFQSCVLPPPLGCLHYGGSMHLWNVGLLQWACTALYPWTLSSSTFCRNTLPPFSGLYTSRHHIQLSEDSVKYWFRSSWFNSRFFPSFERFWSFRYLQL
jgi:hypothetical protein